MLVTHVPFGRHWLEVRYGNPAPGDRPLALCARLTAAASEVRSA